ncbi:MAG: hypothetical protein ABI593_01350 [Betaproteobacteria bacterium]
MSPAAPPTAARRVPPFARALHDVAIAPVALAAPMIVTHPASAMPPANAGFAAGAPITRDIT